MKKIKSYLEEYDLVAKKVWTKLDKLQNNFYNNPLHYINKTTDAYVKKKGYYKDTYDKRYLYDSITNKKYNPQVVIKITGADKNFNQLKNHIRYISRNGELDIFVKEGDYEICYKGKEFLKEIANSYNDEIYNIPTEREIKNENLKEKKENIHMVFSMKGVNNVSPNDLKLATIKTIRERYPYSHFILATHQDTANTHCHLDLKAVDEFGKRIYVSPKDLENLRNTFAKKLNKLGVDAINKSKKRNIFSKDKFADKWEGHKPHHYKITDYGFARYNFSLDEKQKMSYYVKYETSKGKETILWGNHLEKLVKDNKIMIDDYVRFAITAQEEKVVNYFDKESGIWCCKSIFKNIWDCSIENKNEKELQSITIKKKEYRGIPDKSKQIPPQPIKDNQLNQLQQDVKIKQQKPTLTNNKLNQTIEKQSIPLPQTKTQTNRSLDTHHR